MQRTLLAIGLMFCLVTQSIAATEGKTLSNDELKTKCMNSINQTLMKSLSELGVKVSTEIMTDYANIKRSGNCYLEAWPRDTQAVSALVHFAYQNNIPMRIRGNGHSQNGSTLPQASEILIRTDYLNTIIFEKRGEVTAGAGIPMDSINQYVQKNSDYELPVSNAGGIAPTLGGFISAGGISYTSVRHGGFWNHVSEITIVVGNGEIKHIKSDDPSFPWIFGSMGQLGVITEAKLNLIPKIKESPRYPLNKKDRITYQHSDYFSPNHKPAYWFSINVNAQQLRNAQLELGQFQANFPDAILSSNKFEWPLNQNRFVPPLFYPNNEDFYDTGIWLMRDKAFDKNQLNEIKKAFKELVSKNHYSQYIQAEVFDTPEYYANYFGNETYQSFRKIKATFDPKFLFNTKTVFDK